MLTKSQFSESIAGFPWLDEVFEHSTNLANRHALIGKLRKGRFDTVIDLQNNIRSRRIISLLSPVHVFRYRRKRWNRWLRINFPSLRAKLKTPPPVAVDYLNSLRSLRFRDDKKGISLEVKEEWREQASQHIGEFIKKNSLTPVKTIVLSPGARHKTKTMPVEKWIETSQKAFEVGFNCQILVGDKKDSVICEKIKNSVQHPALDMSGKTGLGTLAALIDAADAAVSCDSAPMHIACAVGTPVAALFGPTVPEFGFAPMRCAHRIVQVEGLSCRPCHPHGPGKCPKKHFKCMVDIQIDEIIQFLIKATEIKTLKPKIESRGNVA